MTRIISPTQRSRSADRPGPQTKQKRSDLDRRAWMSLDSLGYIQNVNSDTERLVGRSRDSLLGKPFTSLICEGYRQTWLRYFLSHRQEGKQGTLELELNVGQLTCRLTVSTNTSALGGILEYDLTLQEVRLMVSKESPKPIGFEFLSDLVRRLPNIVITVNREGDVTFVNHGLLEVPAHRIVGTTFYDYLRPYDQTRFRRALRDAFAFGKTSDFIHEGLVCFPADVYYSVRITPMPIRSGRNKRRKTLEPEAALIVLTDVTDEHRSKHQLENTAHNLQLLGKRMDGVREDERKYLSQELHDQLGQSLTALKIDLSLDRKKFGAGCRPAKLAIKRAESTIDQLIEQVRGLCSEIRPPELDDFGLEAAISSYIKAFRKRTAITCCFKSNIEDMAIGMNTALGIFRVFQEAMTNVVRHSRASQTDVSVNVRDNWLTLTVTDDGQGFPEDKVTAPDSLGLLGMRERTERLGGTLSIQSTKNGSTVIAQVPGVAVSADCSPGGESITRGPWKSEPVQK